MRNEAIAPDDIRAAGVVHFSALLDAMAVYDVVDRLATLVSMGLLPLQRTQSVRLLERYVRGASDRMSRAERRTLYARTLGVPGGTTDGETNRDFDGLWLRFVASVSAFARQHASDLILETPGPSQSRADGQAQVRTSATELALNLSKHGPDSPALAPSLRAEVSQLLDVLAIAEFLAAFGARDIWRLVECVASEELGRRPAVNQHRTRAETGARIFAWLAARSPDLRPGGDALDVAAIASQRRGDDPSSTPTDFDLVEACEQWLGAAGIDEAEVDEGAHPSEAREVRETVRLLLSRSAAFAQLAPAVQTSVARDTALVADYLAVMESAAAFRELIDAVDFPQFVQDLIKGVFAAIVDGTLRQMEAYRDLIAAVAASVDDFRNPQLSDRAVIARLCAAYPELCDPPAEAAGATTTERSRYPFETPDVPPPLDTLGGGAWRRLASSRQQVLATMVMMGVNRIAKS